MALVADKMTLVAIRLENILIAIHVIGIHTSLVTSGKHNLSIIRRNPFSSSPIQIDSVSRAVSADIG
jgi:hypothetical protein